MRDALVMLLALGLGLAAALVHPLLPVGLLLGAALLAFARSSAFAWLLVFVAVLFLRPADLAPGLASAEPAKLAAIATLGVFAGGRLLERDSSWALSPANRWMLVLTVAVAASCVFSTDSQASTAQFSNIFLKVLVLWLLVLNVVQTRERAVALQLATAVLTAVLGGYAVWVKLTGVGLVEETRAGYVGLLADPNDLAFTLLVALAFSLEATRTLTGGRRLLFAVCATLTLGGLVATQSRGGLFGLAACLFVWTRGLGWSRVRSAALVGVGGVVLLFASGIDERRTVSENLTALDASSEGRVDAWLAGARMLKHNPLFGVGFDQSAENFGSYAVDAVSWRDRTSHNLFVQVGAETGLLGLVPFCLLVYFALRTNARLRRLAPAGEPPLEGAYRRSQLPILVGALVAGCFLSMAWSWFLYLLLAQAAVSDRLWL